MGCAELFVGRFCLAKMSKTPMSRESLPRNVLLSDRSLTSSLNASAQEVYSALPFNFLAHVRCRRCVLVGQLETPSVQAGLRTSSVELFAEPLLLSLPCNVFRAC